jgi:hypothetical protein
VLFVPSVLAPAVVILLNKMCGTSNADYKSTQLIRIIVTIMLAVSILPMRRLLQFEAA